MDEGVIENTISILNEIPDYYVRKINPESINPTPYGTILIELFNTNQDFIIEISENDLSFYLEDNSNNSFVEGETSLESNELTDLHLEEFLNSFESFV